MSPPPAGDEIRVRPATPADLAFTARLHRDALPHGLFVELGRRFLEDYHRTFLESPYAVALIAERGGGDGDRPAARCGFLVGTTRNAQHYRWVVRTAGLRLAARAGGRMLRRPATLATFVRSRLSRYVRALTRRLRPRAGTAASEPTERGDAGRTAVLTHVAVVPDARGAGVGTTLTDRFLTQAQDVGAREVQLVTLAGPDGAAGFYRDHGWELIERRTHPGGGPECAFRRRLPAPLTDPPAER